MPVACARTLGTSAKPLIPCSTGGPKFWARFVLAAGVMHVEQPTETLAAQIEKWGEDAEATARRRARWREMEAAGEALAAAS